MTQYTAAEMREMADMHTLFEQEEQARHRFKENTVPIANMHRDTAAMLRQAADAMDRQKALDELGAESQRLDLYDVQRPTPPAKD